MYKQSPIISQTIIRCPESLLHRHLVFGKQQVPQENLLLNLLENIPDLLPCQTGCMVLSPNKLDERSFVRPIYQAICELSRFKR